MKNLFLSAVFAILSIAVMPIHANDDHHPKAEAQKNFSAKGQVVAVDKTARKVKLKHEAIPALDWPAMTMFFPVAEKSQLDALKVGDQIEFEFTKDHGGAPVITQIKAVK